MQPQPKPSPQAAFVGESSRVKEMLRRSPKPPLNAYALFTQRRETGSWGAFSLPEFKDFIFCMEDHFGGKQHLGMFGQSTQEVSVA